MTKRQFELKVKLQPDDFTSPSGVFVRLNDVLPIKDEDDNAKHYSGSREEGNKKIIWSQYQNTDAARFEE